MFLRVSLHLKIIFTGQCTWPTFRWIRCPEFLIRWIQLVVDFFVAFLWLLLLPGLSIGVSLHVKMIFIGHYA